MGLLHRFERRIGGVHAGSSGYVWGLNTAGQRLISRRGPAGGQRLRRPWEPSSLFFDHVLAVSELYVSLREAEAAGQLELLDFQAEPAAWRRWTGDGGDRLIVKPDAFVHSAHGDYEFRHFAEVDLGTESRPVIRRKGEVYFDYWRSGSEQSAASVFPKVLWLVPDAKRKAHVVDALATVDPEAWQLFTVSIGLHSEDLLRPEPPTAEDGP